jgi:hypothetical protein
MDIPAGGVPPQSEWLHHIRIDFESRATDDQVEDLWRRLEQTMRRWSTRTGIAAAITAVDEKRIVGRPSDQFRRIAKRGDPHNN